MDVLKHRGTWECPARLLAPSWKVLYRKMWVLLLLQDEPQVALLRQVLGGDRGVPGRHLSPSQQRTRRAELEPLVSFECSGHDDPRTFPYQCTACVQNGHVSRKRACNCRTSTEPQSHGVFVRFLS